MKIKDILLALARWVEAMFSGSDSTSIKRVTGSFLIMAVIVILFMVAGQVVPVEVWNAIENFCELLVWITVTFFGLNALIDINKIWRSKNPGQGGPVA